MKTSLAALVLLAALTGCAQPGEDSAGDPAGFSPHVPGVARAAVEALVAELGVEASDVESVLVEKVRWHDGSLGCARPGEMYTQATVGGHRITLEVDGEDYEYHAGRGREPFRCEDPTE